ncbi:MAG TPA: prolyl oligopeptidase family serine peptidase, partial [Gemmatimonadales bacterium]|nr:prolyl oligopeptidase family serine peptidase [Gemmatimonadales bacterium]
MLRRVFLAALAAAAVVPALARAQESFTLEQLLSAPFPSGLASGRTGTIAWVFNHRGVRNIWVAEPPGYQPRQLTVYDKDDGQEITGIQFTPDGSSVIYLRGGAPNRQGEIPNPTSDPAGAERAIWVIRLPAGAPRKLAMSGGFALTPEGREIAYVAQGAIWSLALDSGATPRSLVKARGGLGSLRFSPDGSRLAFVSNRGSHAFVGVYDVRARTIRWMDPGVDDDAEPAWSPDGRQIAFLRIPAQFTPRLFVAEREGEPWSIRVADATTGASREIFRAVKGQGSVFREIVGRQLHWTSDGFLVFPWERDGWTHLYAVAAGGGEPRLLTPGEGEVEFVALKPDGRTLVYNANHSDISRRDLYEVTAGGNPRPLTTGNFVEWAPTPSGDGRQIALLRSDARGAARPALLPAAGGPVRDLVPLPAEFPAARLIEPEEVTITAADGMKIPVQLFLPRGIRPGERRPALAFFHGGSRRQMLPAWNYGEYYHNAYALNQYLASRGYVVISVNYRSGIGYGMEFREALNYGAGGGSEFNDVLGAGEYLKARPDVDPAKIGLWGGSYGGYLTAMGLSRASNLFAAGVDFHGVHDWNNGIRNFIPAYDPLKQVEAARLALQSSPMGSLDGWRSPVLLIHGDDDRNVAFTETGTLVEQLRRRGVEHEILVFPDEVHGFLLHST